ncbi:hypothetical protein [Alloyangia pacifica]|uniref:Uncharacterized protein n=1 Tax=Alloyangia pacifica TaxID=311180 RepID=A0A1I6VYG8_9RHOB|nr:hypothetical protein [Alloyangia pacifica]SDI18268.1 hypothetical protein SAMN04488245_11337 [Alloyangia pacifica]SFT18752.1 hypothetical protein SAMN04488050_113186 [Alloyangia pacifica]
MMIRFIAQKSLVGQRLRTIQPRAKAFIDPAAVHEAQGLWGVTASRAAGSGLDVKTLTCTAVPVRKPHEEAAR